jgi:hypothetical protein
MARLLQAHLKPLLWGSLASLLLLVVFCAGVGLFFGPRNPLSGDASEHAMSASQNRRYTRC